MTKKGEGGVSPILTMTKKENGVSYGPNWDTVINRYSLNINGKGLAV